uniref:Mu-theraphotoxin-Se1a n=1 Tax=Selenocosmia effera TaxID=2024412 RepID=NTA_SELEF|nr:RecName: Full=Mu-theraphotoxin-Se1a; Short=Mu-TRTX-Se1a [Selenocosmia effera]
DCLGWMAGCDFNDNKCCAGYVCKKHPWCRYDL